LSKRILKRCEKGKPAVRWGRKVTGLTLLLRWPATEQRGLKALSVKGDRVRAIIDAIINVAVIMVLWLAGTALVAGLCALALYLLYLVWQVLPSGV
jgi:hypothetical protein